MLEDNLKSNLSFSDLLRGRLISQSKDMSLSNIELQQIQYIFEDHFKLSTRFDFQKVKMVGQGFADEVFRVFQTKYPDIEIKYTNANDDILFMIQRSI